MIANLAPCPLCGSTEKLMVYSEYLPDIKKETGVVKCTTSLCPMLVREDSIEKAVEKWNKRPIEDMLRDKLQIAMDALERISTSIVGMRDYPNNTSVTNDAREALEKIKGENNERNHD